MRHSHYRDAGKVTGFMAFFAALALLLNIAFWGALIYFGLWCLNHFGVI